MGRGEDNTLVSGTSLKHPLQRKSQEPDRAGLFKILGRYIYLDGSDAVSLNYFADQVKYLPETKAKESTLSPEANENRAGVFSAYDLEDTEHFLNEYAAMAALPVKTINLKEERSSRGGWGGVLAESSGQEVSGEDIIRAVRNPGVFLIDEDKIPGRYADDQDKNDQKSIDKRQEAIDGRRALRKIVAAEKHPEALVFFVRDWASRASIEKDLKDIRQKKSPDTRVVFLNRSPGRNIQGQAQALRISPFSSGSHIINRTSSNLDPNL